MKQAQFVSQRFSSIKDELEKGCLIYQAFLQCQQAPAQGQGNPKAITASCSPQKICCGFEGSGARKCGQSHLSHCADPTLLVAVAWWDTSVEGCTHFNVNILP